MRLLVVAAAALSFVLYAHAIRKLFARDSGVDRRMQLLQAAGGIAAAMHIWALWTHPGQPFAITDALALVLYLVALVVFWSARRATLHRPLTLAFSPDNPEHLNREGIYGRIRHPFYTAYSLTWLAGIIAAPSAWTACPTLVMFAFYWRAATLEEAKFARSELADHYREYSTVAGMFWPKM